MLFEQLGDVALASYTSTAGRTRQHAHPGLPLCRLFQPRQLHKLVYTTRQLCRRRGGTCSAGRPKILPKREMEKVVKLFKNYGRQPDRAAGRKKTRRGKT